jgi:hypothetical protein
MKQVQKEKRQKKEDKKEVEHGNNLRSRCGKRNMESLSCQMTYMKQKCFRKKKSSHFFLK